jgi:hypothetical protein
LELADSYLESSPYFKGLKSDLKEIKDNHLDHIEANTSQMKDDLRELVGFFKGYVEGKKKG